MNIRVAKIDDSPAIAEVHVRTWRSAYKNILPDELLNNLSIEKRTEAWKNGFEAADNGTAIVAELPDAGIVGWAHFSKSRDDDNGRCSVGEITGIYILSEYWRQGIGRGILRRRGNQDRRATECCFRLYTLPQRHKGITSSWILNGLSYGGLRAST